MWGVQSMLGGGPWIGAAHYEAGRRQYEKNTKHSVRNRDDALAKFCRHVNVLPNKMKIGMEMEMGVDVTSSRLQAKKVMHQALHRVTQEVPGIHLPTGIFLPSTDRECEYKSKSYSFSFS